MASGSIRHCMPLLALLLSTGLLSSGLCRAEEPAAPVPVPAEPLPAEPLPVITVPELTAEEKTVTAEEARLFVDRVLAAVREEETSLPLDVNRFCLHLGAGLTEDDQTLELLSQFTTGVVGGMGRQFRSLVAADGSYELQSIFEIDGRRHVRMRLIQPEGALNYHDYVLIKTPDGVFAEDFDNLVAGERISRTLNRMAAAMIADQKLGVFRLIPGVRPAMATHIKTFAQITKLTKEDPAQALKLIETLPPELQTEKIILVQRLSAALRVDEEDYRDAVETFIRHYPEDPAMPLLQIDSLFLKQEYDEALKAVEQLDRLLGGDPYLNLFRGNITAQMGDKARGVQLARQAADALPQILPLHWSALEVMLTAEDYEAGFELLKEIDARFEVEWHDLSKVDAYAGFVKSPYYRNWEAFLKEQNITPVPPTE